MSEEVADILAGTREYIEKHGWIQGRYRDALGNACAVGGMLSYLGLAEGLCFQQTLEEKGVVSVCTSLAKAVGLSSPYGRRDCISLITDWNDDEGTTKQAVLDALAKAEKIERTGFDPDTGIEINDG